MQREGAVFISGKWSGGEIHVDTQRDTKKRFYADLVCFEQIIVEIKALPRLLGTEEAQLLNDLNGTGFPVGVLINFGSHGTLEWKRSAI